LAELSRNIPPDGSAPELEESGLSIKITEIKHRRLSSAVVSGVEV